MKQERSKNAVLLWNRFMGNIAYDCQNPDKEGTHIYCHSRKDGKDGVVYLVINNSLTETTTAELAPGTCTFSYCRECAVNQSNLNTPSWGD